MNPVWRARYELAVDAANQAARVALNYFSEFSHSGCASRVEWKADSSPVTVADREAETLLRTTLLGKFPEDAFLGEEFGGRPGSTGFRWVIDPIDGTRNYVRGIPLWATLVGLEYRGESIAGVAVVPALGLTYRALRGDGAYRGDQSIHVSDVNTLDQAMLFHCSLRDFLHTGCEQPLLNLTRSTQRQRCFGGFYSFVLIAQGSGDLMMEPGANPWDLAALKPILEEAGGRITSWDGRYITEHSNVLASNGQLHNIALSVIDRPPG